jgi:Sulfotransferase family
MIGNQMDLPAAENEPIFVHATSRTGGTLMATILDAHPDIAMSYEIYPELLELEDGSPAHLKVIAGQIEAHETFKEATAGIEPRNLRTFLVRCGRSGLDHVELAGFLREHAAEDDFDSLEGRQRFMKRCCTAKMQKQGKRRWGAKCSRLEQALGTWPEAHFLCMLRDGRDVLASQQNNGTFTNTPEDVARRWTRTHLRFRELINDPGVNAHEIRYERLVSEPEPVIREIVGFLDVPFAPAMLEPHQADLTLFAAPKAAGHMSAPRIAKPIDESSIGRWRRELSEEDLDRFYSAAGDALAVLGYEVEPSTRSGIPD